MTTVVMKRACRIPLKWELCVNNWRGVLYIETGEAGRTPANLFTPGWHSNIGVGDYFALRERKGELADKWKHGPA